MPRLYIGRLNQRVTERDLKRFFDGYGKIREIFMKNGYAFLVSISFDYSVFDNQTILQQSQNSSLNNFVLWS